ncbi:FadR/GntR family transcriptional regulator [Aquibacillus albus]|uniref:DNA-binding FadR family transcriptional regulator n=1 Tax=Aquibacillus albus TaxID=1168171 RepID=A0ABS2N6E1_9BACI|nr:FadR/GntR family transcriptional regulator [Aquibacillus albus]MBM7573729.1 DNA-binding FadR family transcriptional regulator [Aquibacillus albus]
MALYNLSEQLLQDIGKQIINGDLKPGTVLPKVETLSKNRGVSRTVVREALKGLVARRLVMSSTKVGTIVRERSEWLWMDPNVLLWASESNNQKLFYMQLLELRLAIEPAGVHLAAQNATEKDKEEIRFRYNQLESSFDNVLEWPNADYEFHNSILLAAHNELMLSLVKNLREVLIKGRQINRNVNKSLSDDEERYKGLLLHKAVMEAICAGDGQLAQEKMREQLLRLVEIVKAYPS